VVAQAGFGEAIEMHDIDRALEDADVVIASTGASQFVLDARQVAAAMALRPQRALFVVDIAVPRDVDPEVVTVPNVSLVDVDGLRSVVDERLNARRQAIPTVERLIAEHAERFESWYRSRATVPVISRLTQKAEAMRAREVERLFSRCPELNERQRTLIVGASMTIVSKLLHSAILKIRDKAGVDRAAALSDARTLNELFDLELSGELAEAIAGVPPDAR
jgi:glutamyl-tRNA reductase